MSILLSSFKRFLPVFPAASRAMKPEATSSVVSTNYGTPLTTYRPSARVVCYDLPRTRSPRKGAR